MHKGSKSWVKPGWATQKMTEYEKQRRQQISENQARMKDAGLHRAANALMGSGKEIIQTSSSKKNKKRSMIVEDDEYRLSDDEEAMSYSSEDDDEYDVHGDDESNRTQMKKVAPMAPGRQSLRHISTSTPTETPTERATPEIPLALAVSITPTQIGSAASSKTTRRVRGVTRGKGIEKLVARVGKLPVEVPKEYNAPVGKNATSLVNELGKEVRMNAPLQGIDSWNDIDPSIKAAIIQRARDKFDIQGYANDERVQNKIDSICSKRYIDWKCVMHRHYQKLLKQGLDPKIKPFPNVSMEDWTYMIDHVWTVDEFKAKSKKAKGAREKLPYNHACGSRSFPAAMSIMELEDGEKPHIVDFYKKSHWSKKKNNWMSEECKRNHEKFVELRNMCSQPDATPMTQEEMSIKVLGPRKGYLRGYGTGPKPSSSRGTTNSQMHIDEVNRMREEIVILKGLNGNQQQQLEAQDKKFHDFQAFTLQMFERAGILPGNLGGVGDDDQAPTSGI